MDMKPFADRSWHFAALLGPSHIARKKKGAVARSQNGLMRQPLQTPYYRMDLNF